MCSVCSHRVFPKASVVNGMAASLNKETTPDLCSRPQVDVRRLVMDEVNVEDGRTGNH